MCQHTYILYIYVPPYIWLVHTHTHNRFTTPLEHVWEHPGEQEPERQTRKVKTNLDLLVQEIVSDSGICWAICESAPHPRQPRQHPTTQFFAGRIPFLPPNQQRQSTEGKYIWLVTNKNLCRCRGSARRVLSFVSTKVTFRLTKGHWYSCHLIDHT